MDVANIWVCRAGLWGGLGGPSAADHGRLVGYDLAIIKVQPLYFALKFLVNIRPHRPARLYNLLDFVPNTGRNLIIMIYLPINKNHFQRAGLWGKINAPDRLRIHTQLIPGVQPLSRCILQFHNNATLNFQSNIACKFIP